MSKTPYQMPTGVIEEYIQTHKTATTVGEANPIDEELVQPIKKDFVTIQYNLAAIQAVMDLEDNLPESLDGVTELHETPTHLYYKVTSQTYYQIMTRVYEKYEARVSIENLQEVINLHTKQLLQDLHDYTGDFKNRKLTLSNAMNDNTINSGEITREDVPDNANYGYVDSRGLVVMKDTHKETSKDSD